MAEQAERFTAAGGRIMGGIGLLLVAAVVIVGVVDGGVGYHPAVYAACGLVAVVIWAVMLRPAVVLDRERLVLRGALDTVVIPLAAVEQASVGQFLVVRAGGRRYSNTATGRSARQAARDDRVTEATLSSRSVGGFVESRIRRRVEDARAMTGIADGSPEQAALADDVRREWAWPELGLAAVLALALVVTVLL